jgi:hypothetical protein
VLCGGTLLLTLAVLAGWWFARNYLLYGDPLGQRVFNWYFEDTPRWAQFRDEMGWSFGRYLSQLVLPTSIATFWGAFGHLDPRRPDLFMGAYGSGAPGPHWGYPPRSWLYPLLLLAVVVSLAGWAAALVRRRAAPAPAPAGDAMTKAAAVPIWVHGVFVLAAYFNFNATYFQAQGRYLFPAIGGISMLLAGGWLALVPQRRRRAAVGVIALAMAALATYAVFGVIAPGFAK